MRPHVLFAACLLPLAAQQDSKYPAGMPASLAGFKDEGVFALLLNEERIGTMQFTWKPDGNFESQATISMAGQTINARTRITPDANGRWTAIDLEAPQGHIVVSRDGTEGKRTFKDKTTTFTTRADAVLFDNNSPALMSHAIRRYDRSAGGRQEFPLLIIPGVGVSLFLEMKDRVERSAGGRDLELTRFVYGVAGVDILVLADQDGRVYLAEVPAQNATFVRESYEALRRPPETDPLLSKATHEVKLDKAVGVPMRDGIKLETDIYRPAGIEKAPVVRTPYKKEMAELQARFYARRGYIAAIQDVRGRFGSPGVWEPFVNEAKDGYDTIEWLAKQPWSTGKVGMIGASYLGWVQWWAASQKPPHLVTIIPNVAPPDPFYNIPYEYGAFFLWGAIWWADVVAQEATADLSGVVMSRILEKKYSKLLRALPVIDLDKTVLGKENPYWRRWIEHNTNDSYWQRASFLDKLKEVRIPVFHQSGWFDGDGIGSKLNYSRMAEHRHPYQKLTLGPWGHTDRAMRRFGDRDFGAQAIVDLQHDYLRWFDYWLKGIDNGIAKEPLVNIFVMGSNKWLSGPSYPLPQTKPAKLYLSSGGQANTSKGDGRLTFDVPAAGGPVDRFVYDPGDPTPDPRMYEEPEEEEKKVKSVEERKKAVEAYHESVTSIRNDVLVYSTDVLTKPLTFAGPVSAVLYAATSARDTDWFMYLVEVDKDGKTFTLGQGKIRARFRRSMSKPELLKPGKVYQYNIDLWQTGITIPAGSRLRVEVSSAAFPTFSRNLNTGGHNEKETRFLSGQQTIYHDRQYPSHIVLPVIPD